MLTVRYWTDSTHAGRVSPFGDVTRVLTRRPASERVMRSLTTWCALNGFAFRIGVCGDPRSRADQFEGALVEVGRAVDDEMVHITYVRKPWHYMHVLHRTTNAAEAERLRQQYIGIGRSLGRCENNERDLVDPVHHAPYFVYMLTGKLPPRSRPVPQSPDPEPPPMGLTDLAGL